MGVHFIPPQYFRQFSHKWMINRNTEVVGAKGQNVNVKGH